MGLTASSHRPFRLILSFSLAVVALVALLPLASGAATLQLPKGVSKKQAYTMYAEQLDSQAAIEDLVAGDIVQFTVRKRSVASSEASLTLEVRYANGFTRRGTMRLFKANDVWFMRSITHHTDGTEHISSTDRADTGVVNTILAEQLEYASMSDKLVKGTYTKISVGKPKVGYRSAELPVTFAGGGASARTKGRVTCISKVVDGERAWFITGFAE